MERGSPGEEGDWHRAAGEQSSRPVTAAVADLRGRRSCVPVAAGGQQGHGSDVPSAGKDSLASDTGRGRDRGGRGATFSAAAYYPSATYIS